MGEGDVHIDINDPVQLLFAFDDEKRDRSKHHSGSIYMVPSVFRDLSPDSYTPRVVSIGPLHHGDDKLKGFEVQKEICMYHLFHNVLRPLDSTPEQIMQACVTRVSGSIDKIKACYIGMETCPDSKLVKIMVTDACFILAFLYNYEIRDPELGQNPLLFPHIFTDMVLLENQIPFFVLQDIFDCTFSEHYPETPTLPKIILTVVNVCRIVERNFVLDSSSIPSTPDNNLGSISTPDNNLGFISTPDNNLGSISTPDNNLGSISTHDHILGFIHKFYQHPDGNSSTLNKMLQGPSVIELDRSGVRFSNKLDEKWPMAMKLSWSKPTLKMSWSKPTLHMSVLRLVDDTEFLIKNLIQYEQSSQVQMCITSYMHALDTLIDTPEDVATLVKSRVIVNYLGSDERASNLINSMLKEVTIDEFFYQDEWKRLGEYYTAKWPKFIAELRRSYFSNPWRIIAVLAGSVLFVLTGIQTVYSVKAA